MKIWWISIKMLLSITMWHSIKQIIDKIKHFYTHVPIEVLFSVIIILVGFSAFGLGRLSVISESQQKSILLYDTNLNTKPILHIAGAVVASKKGKKYHYPWCSGANRMSEKNKRWFKSIQDARDAGYLPAGNCKGLK